ncbi:MAG: c-type cytochrome, partial [Verrucomicrobiota bacterium]
LRDGSQPRRQRHALEAIAEAGRIGSDARAALLELLGRPLDPALEHAAMYAALVTRCFTPETLAGAREPAAIRRLLRIVEQTAEAETERAAVLAAARTHAGAPDRELAAAAAAVIARAPGALGVVAADLRAGLDGPAPAPATVDLALVLAAAHLADPQAQELVTRLLGHSAAEVRRAAWAMLALQPALPGVAAWAEPLGRALAAVRESAPADLPVLLDVAARLRAPTLSPVLADLVGDARLAPALRLRALAAAHRPEQPVPAASFTLLREIAGAADSPAARMEAARLLGRGNLDPLQVAATAPLLATSGPVELGELLRLARRKLAPGDARLLAEQLARSPFLGALEESAIRSAFSFQPPEIYEEVLRPAVQAAATRGADKRRRLETLAAAAGRGRAGEGGRLYAASACAGCHRAGGTGQAIGPDLSRIGAIRGTRELLESILFPDATIAREFEAHVVETADRQTHLGTIRSDSAEVLILAGPGGETRVLPRRHVVAITPAPGSLMPAGLEEAFTDQQLLDLVAWLRSLQ